MVGCEVKREQLKIFFRWLKKNNIFSAYANSFKNDRIYRVKNCYLFDDFIKNTNPFYFIMNAFEWIEHNKFLPKDYDSWGMYHSLWCQECKLYKWDK